MKEIEKEFISLKAESVIEDIERILSETFDHYINVDPELSLLSENNQQELAAEMKEFFTIELERRFLNKGMLRISSNLQGVSEILMTIRKANKKINGDKHD